MNLKSCPHCGSTAERYPDGDVEGYTVMCSGDKDPQRQCPSGVFGYKTQAEADAAWNTRSDVAPASDELIEALDWLDKNLANPDVDMSYKVAHLQKARAAVIRKEADQATATELKEPQAIQYTVVAYRWGWTNTHRYLVASTKDLDRAIEFADAEASDRGGKYGVSVYAWEDEEVHVRVHYTPSIYGEDEPYENHRIEMFSNVGHRAHQLATTGQVYLVDPAEEGQKLRTLKPFVHEVPAWLEQVVRKAETHAFWGSKTYQDIRERQKSGLPVLDESRQEQWFKDIDMAAKAHVDAIFSKRDEKLKN